MEGSEKERKKKSKEKKNIFSSEFPRFEARKQKNKRHTAKSIHFIKI